MTPVPPRSRHDPQTRTCRRTTTRQASSSRRLPSCRRPYPAGPAHRCRPIANSIFRKSLIWNKCYRAGLPKYMKRNSKAGKTFAKPTTSNFSRKFHKSGLPEFSGGSSAIDQLRLLKSSRAAGQAIRDQYERKLYRTRSGAKPTRWTFYMMRSPLCEVPPYYLFPKPIYPSPVKLERVETRKLPQSNLCFSAAKKDVIKEYIDAGRPDGFCIQNPKLVGFIIEELLAEPPPPETGTPAAPPVENQGIVGEDTAYTRTF